MESKCSDETCACAGWYEFAHFAHARRHLFAGPVSNNSMLSAYRSNFPLSVLPLIACVEDVCPPLSHKVWLAWKAARRTVAFLFSFVDRLVHKCCFYCLFHKPPSFCILSYEDCGCGVSAVWIISRQSRMILFWRCPCASIGLSVRPES